MSTSDPKYISEEEYPLLDTILCSAMLLKGPVKPLIIGGMIVPLHTMISFDFDFFGKYSPKSTENQVKYQIVEWVSEVVMKFLKT